MLALKYKKEKFKGVVNTIVDLVRIVYRLAIYLTYFLARLLPRLIGIYEKTDSDFYDYNKKPRVW